MCVIGSISYAEAETTVTVELDPYYAVDISSSAICKNTGRYDGDRCVNPKDFKFEMYNGGKYTPFVGARGPIILQASPGPYSIYWAGGIGEFVYNGEVKFSLDSNDIKCSGSVAEGKNADCILYFTICKGIYCG